MMGKESVSGLSAAQRELLQRRLRGARSASINPAPIERRIDTARAPLSCAQQGLWFLDRLDPGSAVYNIAMSVKIAGAVHVPALQAGLNDIVARHEVLRTTFREEDGEAVQVISAVREITLEWTDLQESAPELREEEVRRIGHEEGGRPFDLASGPLIRAHLVRLGARAHLLLLTVHHIVFDAWSASILLKELAVFYEQRSGHAVQSLPGLPIQYGDFATWQRGWLMSDAGQRELAYWSDHLRGAPPLLDLPADHARPAVRTGRGQIVQALLGPETTQALRALSRNEGGTLFATVLAVFYVLLLRYTGQPDLIIGTPVANRNRRELEPLLGYLVNMLALRIVISGDPTFREFLGNVRNVVGSALAHSSIPFDRLVEALDPVRSSSHNPIFQVGYQYQLGMATEYRGAGLDLVLTPNETDSAKFDLTLSVWETAGDLAIALEYSTDLFESQSVERMLTGLQTLLHSVVANPDQTIRHLVILDETERSRILFEWNATATDAPLDVSLPQMFEARVEHAPEAIALVGDTETLTYRVLNERANQLAQHLIECGVTAGSRVAICMERSVDMIIGVLGILKAGAAYVPLDPAYPGDRLAFMLEDAAAPVLLTQSRLRDVLPAAYPGVTICLGERRSELEARSPLNGRPVSADSLAYVIYTSGSSGRPKGVMLRHRGLTNLVLAQSRAFGVVPGRKVLQFASLSFDAAISEIGMTLTSGAALHLVGQEAVGRVDVLTRQLQDQEIDVATLPPSLLTVLDPQQLPGLRTIISAGEVCTWDIAQRWREGREFFNAYGPTEATVGPTFYQVGVQDAPSRTVPIGRPIANTRIYVLDSNLQPVPVGVPGEIFIGGVGVALGYLNNPEMNAERFIANPFVADRHCRLYRSGDLGRFLPDGNLEFMGRIDQQVKIRGFRIEIGELEAIVARHPGVREVVALAIGAEADRRLAVCVVANDELVEMQLRNHLKRYLPAYMLPSVIWFMERFPLTPNGKVDRKALMMKALTPDSARVDMVAPRSASERLVLGAFSEVLGRDQISVLDDFFRMGGHSLMAARLMARVRELSGRDIPLRHLFDHPTAEGLAAVVDAFRWTASATSCADPDAGEREELEF